MSPLDAAPSSPRSPFDILLCSLRQYRSIEAISKPLWNQTIAIIMDPNNKLDLEECAKRIAELIGLDKVIVQKKLEALRNDSIVEARKKAARMLTGRTGQFRVVK